MAQALNIAVRQPRQRSPEELRAFYNIALHAKDDVEQNKLATAHYEGVTACCDAQSIASRSWVSYTDDQAQSSRATSLFSRRPTIASSATSISDIKAPTVLARREQYETHPNRPTLPCLPYALPNNVRGELSALRDVRLDLGCRLCRVYNLGCDRAKPSCSNCVQNFQECFYGQGEDGIGHEPGCQSPSKLVPVADPRHWRDSLDEHPYYSLDENRKLSRVDTWYLKLRHRRPSTVVSQNAESVNVDAVVENGSEYLLKRSSPEPYMLDDVVEDAALAKPISSAESDRPSGKSFWYSSGRTILLDLGVVPNPSKTADCLHLSDKSISSSSNFDSEKGWSIETKNVAENLSEPPLHYSDLTIHEIPKSFHCLFCWKRFGNQNEWEDHEFKNHIARQNDWVCMPRGSIVENEDGKNLCAFCGAADQDSSHALLQHEADTCLSGYEEDRTFRNKLDFQAHLQDIHNLENITEWMDTWCFPREDDAGYWNCGFCDRSFGRWTDRVMHIGEHFKRGLTIASWDPLVSPYPIEKTTGAFISWFPPVDRKVDKSFTTQLERLKQFTRTPAIEQLYDCQHCTIALPTSVDAQRHEEIWHSPRDVWSCPTTTDITIAKHLQTGPLASYLFPESPESDRCPYCDEHYKQIFSPDLDDGFVDWAMRVEHLRDEHGFDRCDAGLRFHRDDLFLLHLAGHHGLRIGESVGEVVDECRRGKRTLEDILGR